MELDEIGLWSEIKLEIIKKYAHAYSVILNKHSYFKHYYIDAFAGAGIHLGKQTKNVIPGSPVNAINIEPPFNKYFLIDINPKKIIELRKKIGGKDNVEIITGNCNEVLPQKVFPLIKRKEFKRALCFLDPYGLHLDWDVIAAAGKMETIEIFLNFPTLDMNRNVLWKKPDLVTESQLERMNKFWGDSSWFDYIYDTSQTNLFKSSTPIKKSVNSLIVAFQKRLKKIAGFNFVPEPIPMRNESGGLLYYLYFASPNPTANKIVTDIFNQYRRKGWN